MGKKRKQNPLKLVQTLDLKKDNRWHSKPGYNIFVAERGAVRLDVPRKWTLTPQEKSFQFTEKAPPDHDCCLELSYNRLPPADFSSFPLEDTVLKLAKEDKRNPFEISDIITVPRQTARIAWSQIKFIDPKEDREAYSRTCVGLGSGIQCLITFDYWADQAEQLTPVWDVAMETLTLGLYISDPTTGYALPD